MSSSLWPLGKAAPVYHSATLAAADQEAFQSITDRSPLIPLPVLIATAMVAMMGWEKVSSVWIVLISALVCGLSVLRIALLKRLKSALNLSIDQRLSRLSILNFCVGLTHCSSLLLFPLLGEAQRSILTILLLGMAIGTVALAAGCRSAYGAYITITMGALSFCWFYFPLPGVNPWVPTGLALLIIYLTLLMFMSGASTFKNLLETVDGRTRQADLNTELRTALDRAETANRAKTRFLASASHDLRQPLHTLSMFSAALQMRPLDPRSAEIARNINIAMQELSTELDSLLDISKLDAGVIKASPVSFKLIDVLHSVQRIYEPVAIERGIGLQVQVDPTITVHTDRALFERVIRNLVDNAIKYSEDGIVIIHAKMPATSSLNQVPLQIFIRDQGIGIDEQDLSQIFDEFFQIANPERSRAKGLGLGLAIVQRLCLLLEINLTANSVLGAGSTFELSMPATRTALTDHAAVQQSVIHQLRGLSILVIDDEQGVRDSMLAVLTEIGCTVVTAANATEAKQTIKANRPNIVLADLRLQGDADGIAAINELRQHWPNLPAILISGDTEPVQIQAANQAQIQMLHKPVDLDNLARAVAYELGPK